jgi:hypothetical protein
MSPMKFRLVTPRPREREPITQRLTAKPQVMKSPSKAAAPAPLLQKGHPVQMLAAVAAQGRLTRPAAAECRAQETPLPVDRLQP